eukprot:3780695-Alexandrium_andersonii.AAC.1
MRCMRCISACMRTCLYRHACVLPCCRYRLHSILCTGAWSRTRRWMRQRRERDARLIQQLQKQVGGSDNQDVINDIAASSPWRA